MRNYDEIKSQAGVLSYMSPLFEDASFAAGLREALNLALHYDGAERGKAISAHLLVCSAQLTYFMGESDYLRGRRTAFCWILGLYSLNVRF